MTDISSSRELEEFCDFIPIFKKLTPSRELEEFCDSISTLKKLWHFIVFEKIIRILWLYFYFKQIVMLYCLRENWKSFVILLLLLRIDAFERIGRILWFYSYSYLATTHGVPVDRAKYLHEFSLASSDPIGCPTFSQHSNLS